MDRRRFLGLLGVGTAAAGSGVGTHAAVAHADSARLDRAREAGANAAGSSGSLTVTWSMATEDKAVALTFDDGPTPVFTPQVLDLLDRYQAHATFFVIGGLLDDNASLIARMVQAGHEIGNHTWSHVSAALLDDAAARDQQQRGVEAIKRYTGRVPAWYRPPRGMLTGASIRIAHELGQHVAMWSVDRGPAADIDVDGVRQHLVSSLAPGAVIDLHDGVGSSGFEDPTNYDNSLVRRRETELAALPDLLHQAMDAGYRFVTMSELMGLPERR